MDGIDFLVADPKKYREDARLKAVRAAREKANKMAAELGQSLGKPWQLTEEADPERTAYLAANFQQHFSFGMPEQEASTIAGGEVSIRSTTSQPDRPCAILIAMSRFFQNAKRSLESLLNLITDLVADGLLFFRLPVSLAHGPARGGLVPAKAAGVL